MPLVLLYCLLMCSYTRCMEQHDFVLVLLYTISTTLKNITSLPTQQEVSSLNLECQKESSVVDALEIFNHNKQYCLTLNELNSYTPLLFSKKINEEKINQTSVVQFAAFLDYLDINKECMTAFLRVVYEYDKAFAVGNDILRYLLCSYCSNKIKNIGYTSIKPARGFFKSIIQQHTTQSCTHDDKKSSDNSTITLNDFADAEQTTHNTCRILDFAFDEQQYVKLKLSHLKLSSLEGLDKVIRSFFINSQSIKQIDISDNALKGIFNVDTLMSYVSKIEYIDMHNNEITDFHASQHYPSVLTLVCDEQYFNGQPVLEAFKKLFPNIHTVFLVKEGVWQHYSNRYSAWIYQNARRLPWSDEVAEM